jgi:hypothetical protein
MRFSDLRAGCRQGREKASRHVPWYFSLHAFTIWFFQVNIQNKPMLPRVQHDLAKLPATELCEQIVSILTG